MATDRETIIDPDNGTGTDYTNMDAWEDAWGGVADSGDCVGQDERAVGVLRCTGGSEDTTNVVVFAGWTDTDATRYAMVIAKNSEGYRHAGVWPSAGENIYRHNTGGGSPQITLQQPFSRLYGVACKDRSLNGNGTIEVETGGCVVEGCLCSSARTGTAYGIYVHGFTSSDDTYLGNNMVTGYGGTSIGIYVGTVTTSKAYCHHNTVTDCYVGIKQAAAAAIAVCNLVYDTTTAFSGTFTGSNNGYDSGSAPTSNDTDLSGYAATDLFNDAASGDYTLLVSPSNPAYRQGTDLSGDADYPVTDDWQGEVRTSFDLGFDEIGLFPENPPDTRREALDSRISRWSLRVPIRGPLPESGYRTRP